MAPVQPEVPAFVVEGGFIYWLQVTNVLELHIECGFRAEVAALGRSTVLCTCQGDKGASTTSSEGCERVFGFMHVNSSGYALQINTTLLNRMLMHQNQCSTRI